MAKAFRRMSLLRPGATTPLGRISWSGFGNDPQGQATFGMRAYGEYALVYLLEGTGQYRDGLGVEQKLTPGDLIVTFPDIPRVYSAPQGAVWHEFFLVFTGPVFDLWRGTGLLDDSRRVRRLEPMEYWLRQLQHVVTARGEGAAQALARVCALQGVLADILDYEKQRALGEADRTWLAQAVARLEGMDLSRRPNYGPVLAATGLTYAGFRARFTRVAGVSPGRYLGQLQVRRVCELLEQTDLKLRAIAERCGFTDEFHLSRRFKQLMGMTPTEFRQRMPRSGVTGDE